MKNKMISGAGFVFVTAAANAFRCENEKAESRNHT